MKCSTFIVLGATFVVFLLGSVTAWSRDIPEADTGLKKVTDLNKQGKYGAALNLIDKTFKDDIPLVVRMHKAESLVGMGRVSDAFSLIGKIRQVLEQEERFEMAAKVLFEFDKSTLLDAAELRLSNVLKQIQDRKVRIRIDGHTDNTGGEAYNQALSRDRAKTVERFLVSQGVAANTITSKGWGFQRPVATNDNDEGRQLNRRVEFIVTGEQQALARKKLATIAAKLPKQLVSVSTVPAGAQVWFDDDLVKETTPFQKKLGLGLHSVRLFMKGYKAVNTTVFVEPDKENRFSYEFEGGPGSLRVTVDQDSLTLQIDGQTVALNSGVMDVPSVSSGTHTAVFMNANRQVVHQANVTVRSGEQTELTFSRYAQIRSKFGDATLEVLSDSDGVPKGAKLSLDTGKYTLVLRRSGYVPIQGILSVQAGQRVTIDNDFEKIPEHIEHRLWALITSTVGLGLVGVATALELMVDQSADWVDTTNFVTGGIGGALFVTGGILYAYVDIVEDPDPEDVNFSIQLGLSPVPNGASFTAFGRF